MLAAISMRTSGSWHSRRMLTIDAELRQRLCERRGGRARRGEDDARRSRCWAGGLGREQIGGAARDCWRGIDECHRPGAEALEASEQQRIMRAGEYDGVGAAAVLLDEAWLDLLGDQLIGDGGTIELRLREGSKPRRADQCDIAAIGEVAD